MNTRRVAKMWDVFGMVALGAMFVMVCFIAFAVSDCAFNG